MDPWILPAERYYYGWYDAAGRPDLPHHRPDGAIKTEIVDRLRANPLTAEHTIRVDVKQAVVILQGDVDSRMAKRAAGDDCWDTLGVADVSNQLSIAGDADHAAELAIDLMTPDPVAVLPTATLQNVALVMANGAIGDVIIVDDDRRPIGIVTDRDLVVFGTAAGRSPDSPVSDLIGPTMHTVRPEATIDEVIAVMTGAAIRRVPVVEDGHLLGVISLGDLARKRDPGSVLAAISNAQPNAA